MNHNLIFFLGGHDLEMATIRDLLQRHAPTRFHDDGLTWGAKASAYTDRIRHALDRGDTVVLVELTDDLALLSGSHADQIINVDHHGPLAGRDRPTALEQVFQRLNLPPSDWCRWHALVATNDRGHVRAMLEIGATPQELAAIRAADRQAQGVTSEEEDAGRRAAGQPELLWDGKLTVVELPHERTATVTDALEPALGGPGYRNLLVLCPQSVGFFGEGPSIDSLRASWPAGFYGGELPYRGFWGYPQRLPKEKVVSVIESTRSHP